MRRLATIIVLFALLAAQLQFAACTADAADAGAATRGDAHAHHHAGAGTVPDANVGMPDGPLHQDGCTMLARCQWSAVPVQTTEWSQQHTGAHAFARWPAASPQTAHPSAETPPPRSLS